jgi:endonuclease YncB( thermonuclease family)
MKRLILLLGCCVLLTCALLAASRSTRLADVTATAASSLRSVAETSAALIAGRVRVLDGDALTVAGVPIRVWGIDAPEWRQRCRGNDGRRYRCGRLAFRALANRLRFASVSCVPRTRDKFGRVVATCFEGSDDIARWMVLRGLALDWPRYSAGAYAPAENEARGAERGLWQGAFMRPWDWRHGKAAITSRP